MFKVIGTGKRSYFLMNVIRIWKKLFCWWSSAVALAYDLDISFIRSVHTDGLPYTKHSSRLGVSLVKNNKKMKTSCPHGVYIVVQIFACVFLPLWLWCCYCKVSRWSILLNFGKSNANEGLGVETWILVWELLKELILSQGKTPTF